MLFNKLFFSSPLTGASAPKYTISGTVYDADGTTAVASATVALGSYTADSGVDGTYTISNIPSGTSGSMTCTKAGYSWTAKTIAAMSANLTSQNYTNAWWAVGGIAASAVAAYRAIGAADYATSKVNLVNPGTYNASDGTAYPTWASATGWTFVAASSQYLTTTLAIGANKNYSVLVRFSNADSGTQAVVGCFTTANTSALYMRPNIAGPFSAYVYGCTTGTVNATAATSGVMGVCGPTPYMNKVAQAVYTQDGTGAGAQPFYMGCANVNGSASSFYGGKIQAVAIYSSKIDTSVSALTDAMNALS